MICHHARDGADEERDLVALQHAEHHGHHQRRHERSLDEVQQILPAQPLLCLATDRALLPVPPALRHHGGLMTEVLAKVLHDEAALG